MAAADYYLCDVCGNKTFYDSNLDYAFGKEQKRNPVTGHPWPNGYIGWMTVICDKCVLTHEVVIRPRTTIPSTTLTERP